MKRTISIAVTVAGLAGGLLAALLLTIAPTQALPAWTTSNSSFTSTMPGTRLVTDLRFATHPGFDRVVIAFTGRTPSWRATYHHRFFRDGSGAPVPIRGGLQLTLMPAQAHDNAGHNIYTGPRLVRPGFPTLKAIAMTGDFEGVVTFAFGLSPERAPYRIFVLHSPQRIVVDFKH